jgi:hypothetical protein
LEYFEFCDVLLSAVGAEFAMDPPAAEAELIVAVELEVVMVRERAAQSGLRCG